MFNNNVITQTRMAWLQIAALLAALVAPIMIAAPVGAAQLENRLLKIESSANGTLTDGQDIEYRFDFDFAAGSGTDAQGIEFEFCTDSIGTCVAPTGLDLTGSAVSAQTGWAGTVWGAGVTIEGGDNGGALNQIFITRTNAVDENGNSVTITLDSITNPTTDNETFFVRIRVYDDTARTTLEDEGVVASSTAEQIEITAIVKETLNFCVGITLPGSATTCTGMSGSDIALGDGQGVLSTTTQYDAISYFRLASNANNGVVVQYSAATLEAGANNIDAAGGTEVAFSTGTEQFGLALESGDAGHNFTTLAAAANYDQDVAGEYAMDAASATTPVTIASTGSGIVDWETGAVEYSANINATTPAGVYTTTVTYIACVTY